MICKYCNGECPLLRKIINKSKDFFVGGIFIALSLFPWYIAYDIMLYASGSNSYHSIVGMGLIIILGILALLIDLLGLFCILGDRDIVSLYRR